MLYSEYTIGMEKVKEFRKKGWFFDKQKLYRRIKLGETPGHESVRLCSHLNPDLYHDVCLFCGRPFFADHPEHYKCSRCDFADSNI